MLTRALIVVLAILNVGVALWWMLRGEPVPAPVEAPAGVARLQFLDTPATPAAAPVAAAPEAASTAPLTDATATPPASPAAPTAAPAAPPAAASVAPTPAAPVAAAPAPTPPAPAPAPAQCLSLGPFADRDTAIAAQGKAGNLLQRSRLREVPNAGASTYRVMMPASASREDAQALVKRIAAAGISDYYILGQGEDANAIALGQYRNREGAERRMAALSAAGFNARLVASGGDGSAQWWVDATLADAASPNAARQRSGAAQQRSLECARLR
ncbi:SPOR domain-containing protein [Stenotrophomonas sp. PS02289]|uniref:SPOR domain-containing protein n=1 Tax=Stenotrophomonas sp. PS02289 TaxID=2991422 RepID=UPI00249C397C|nr:SPOR domain-containing protein [Stenotrophomonas sp. PS02289]